MRTLVVYYSRSGNARRLANDLGEALGADIEEIRCARYDTWVLGAIRACHDSVLGRLPPIGALRREPASYDLVVVAGPVWASRPSAPVRTLLRQHGAATRRVAFMLTLIGSGGEKAIRVMEQICGARPVAALLVTRADLAAGRHLRTLYEFAHKLRRSAG